MYVHTFEYISFRFVAMRPLDLKKIASKKSLIIIKEISLGKTMGLVRFKLAI